MRTEPHISSRSPRIREERFAAIQAYAAEARRKSITHRLSLALVWLAVVSSAVVFSEPAPVDVLTLGLIVLLPAVGLVAMTPELLLVLGGWLVLAASGFLAATFATEIDRSIIHTAISLYLYLAAFVFAAFVALRPLDHGRLILNAYLAAALIASAVAILAYTGALPNSEMFLKFGRASGTFKDPNVFGPFLVPALVYALHLWLAKPFLKGLLPLAALAIVALALLLSFSRGAWIAAVVAIALYCWLYLVTAARNADRVKLAGLGLTVAATLPLVMFAALQVEGVPELLSERASFSQSYDLGPDGRFGGQEKARGLILEHPLGIGALEFQTTYHHEDVHNGFLSMFLNAGWLGGLMFIALLAATLIIGLRQSFRRTTSQPLLLTALSALTAIVFEGVIIDTDHWRHLYVLIGLVWGLVAGEWRAARLHNFNWTPAR